MARFTTAGGSGDGTQGAPGPAGSNGADAIWNYTGEYSGGAAYAVGDLATYDGQLWYRANANGGNVGDTPAQGFIWNLLAAKGTDGVQGEPGAQGEPGTDATGGLVYLGDYVLGNGYVINLAVVRGSDNNLYIAKSSGGLADPVGNTAEWDIFSTNSGGGTDSHGDFYFDESTLRVDSSSDMILEANEGDGSIASQIKIGKGDVPINIAAYETDESSYGTGDWATAEWQSDGNGGGQIVLTDSTNIEQHLNNFNYDFKKVLIDDTTLVAFSGASYGGGNATIYVSEGPAGGTTATVLALRFIQSIPSGIMIDYDDEEMNIVANNMELNLSTTGGETISIDSSDDLDLSAEDDIRFYVDTDGIEKQWRMDSEGEFHLPGNGLIWNPINSSGDGYSGDTIHLVPNDSDNETEQRIIIDPTGPNHIHLRAGGVQDYSSADLILGGERAGVRVSDTDGTTVVQSKQEDWSWSYTNINDVESTTYRVGTSLAEPDYNDFTILNGVKYVINNVVRDEPQGITEYTAIASDSTQLVFYPEWSYTFTRDRGEYHWTFNRAGYLNGPTETGHLRVTGIINDDGNLEVQADQNLILSGGESNGEYLHDSSDPANQIATIGDIMSATSIEQSFTVNGGTLGTQPTFNGDPLFSGTYVINGPMVHFQIQVDMDNITNFGTGQYYVDLPFPAKYGYQVREGCLHDISADRQYAIGGHVSAGQSRLNLFFTDTNGQDQEFDHNSPVTLAIADNFHISGTYISN